MIETGVIKYVSLAFSAPPAQPGLTLDPFIYDSLDGDSKVALVFGQMNEPPGARARVALTGLTIAEYFRDEEGQDVLLFIDNIFRWVPCLHGLCGSTG